MNEQLTLLGQDASAIVAVAALIALVSFLLARRWRSARIWTPRLAAIRAHFSAVSLPAIRLPRLAAPSAWHSFRLPAAGPALAPALPRPEGPLTIDAQWARLTGHLSTRIAAMEQAGALQQRAASQIDAASYALERLLGELADVMALPRASPALQLLAVETRPQPIVRAEPLAA